MKPTAKEVVCQLYIQAVWKDSEGVGEDLAKTLHKQYGIKSSLDDAACRKLLAAEWCLARLAWLELKGSNFSESDLKRAFRAAIDAKTKELLSFTPEVPECPFILYALEARARANGELVSEYKLQAAPGALIGQRYKRHAERIYKERQAAGGFFRRRPNVEAIDKEAGIIMMTADALCWREGDDLNDFLLAQAQVQEEHERERK